MSAWEIYLIGQVDGIQGLIAVFLVISLGVAFFWIGMAIREDTDIEMPSKWLVLVPLTFLLALATIPSGKTLAAMYAIPAILNNENVKALPDDVLFFVRKLMREYTDGEKL